MTEPQKKRTRLSPEVRRARILDAAAALVLTDGLASLTMARIAAAAGTSKALIYAYFKNMAELLYAVYGRETELLNAQHLTALKAPHSFEEMVRATARISRQTEDERQRLVEQLATDPVLASRLVTEERRNRSRVVRFLTKEITANFDIPSELAACATRLALRYGPDDGPLSPEQQQRLDEIWGAMMVGAMTELERRYGREADERRDRK